MAEYISMHLSSPATWGKYKQENLNPDYPGHKAKLYLKKRADRVAE
jgi:hypothetical protein